MGDYFVLKTEVTFKCNLTGYVMGFCKTYKR